MRRWVVGKRVPTCSVKRERGSEKGGGGGGITNVSLLYSKTSFLADLERTLLGRTMHERM